MRGEDASHPHYRTEERHRGPHAHPLSDHLTVLVSGPDILKANTPGFTLGCGAPPPPSATGRELHMLAHAHSTTQKTKHVAV